MPAVFLMIQKNINLDQLFASTEFVSVGVINEDDEVTEVYV
jgi:hypothetical protein